MDHSIIFSREPEFLQVIINIDDQEGEGHVGSNVKWENGEKDDVLVLLKQELDDDL